MHSHSQEEIPEDCEDSGDDSNGYMDERSNETIPISFLAEKDDDIVSVLSSRSNRSNKEVETVSSRQSVRAMSQRQSPHNSSPSDSPTTPCSRNSSPKSVKSSGKIQTSMLRLLSTRAMESVSNSAPISPFATNDNSSISSTETDEETTVCFIPHLTSNLFLIFCPYTESEIDKQEHINSPREGTLHPRYDRQSLPKRLKC